MRCEQCGSIPAEEAAGKHHALWRPLSHVGDKRGDYHRAKRVTAEKDGRRRRETLRVRRLERGLGR